MENKEMKIDAENQGIQKKIKDFQDAELVVPFIDGTFIMKIAGENKWYVVNEKGDVVVRTRPDGTNEFSEVDMEIDGVTMYDIEFGNFIGGMMVAKTFGVSNDQQPEINYVGISPSGYTLNYGLADDFEKEGINSERQYWYTTRIFNSAYSFLSVPSRTYDDIEQVVFRYDIAQYAIVRDFNDLESQRQHFLRTGEEKSEKANKTYRRELSKFATLAKNLRKRYETLLEIVPRKQERDAQSAARKQEKLEHGTDELKQEALDAISAMLGQKQ